jgi:penicillin-insensitive murein endopeptidase
MKRLVCACVMLASCMPVLAVTSECYGRPGRGRLENGVRLPLSGANFSAYSVVAAGAGRTFMHGTAAAIVLDAYARVHAKSPALRYVYGETGLINGGRFNPHRTHQNGLSIDFFVPVRNAAGESVKLPTPVQARFGYDIEFDRDARFGEYTIDFAALAEHLHALDAAARAKGGKVDKVILDTQYLPRLFATKRAAWLKTRVPFMMSKPWVRHDEHYHVDFALRCKA